MRALQRNKRPVAYAFYAGNEEIVLQDGTHTGEYRVRYTPLIKRKMNVSGARGAADVAMFGINSAYGRSIVTDDLTTPFSEETVFWIDADPDTEPHDYKVVGVSRTINQVVIALAEVHVSREDDSSVVGIGLVDYMETASQGRTQEVISA